MAFTEQYIMPKNCYAVSMPTGIPMRFSQNHQQCPSPDECTANEAFSSELLMQEHESKHKRDDHTQLIDGNNL